jgi:hypothetical protein
MIHWKKGAVFTRSSAWGAVDVFVFHFENKGLSREASFVNICSNPFPDGTRKSLLEWLACRSRNVDPGSPFDNDGLLKGIPNNQDQIIPISRPSLERIQLSVQFASLSVFILWPPDGRGNPFCCFCILSGDGAFGYLNIIPFVGFEPSL